MKYKDGGIVTSGHDLRPVERFEGLVYCARCNCAEGTLPDQCPGVPVPGRVQTLIHRGVVNFSNGRWVGENSPSRRLGRALRAAARCGVTFRAMADNMAAAGQVVAQFGRSFRGR